MSNVEKLIGEKFQREDEKIRDGYYIKCPNCKKTEWLGRITESEVILPERLVQTPWTCKYCDNPINNVIFGVKLNIISFVVINGKTYGNGRTNDLVNNTGITDLGSIYDEPTEPDSFSDQLEEEPCDILVEGTEIYRLHVAKERNREARERCIGNFGATCQVCGFDFEQVYGDIGVGFIEVHHIVPIHQRNGIQVIDPNNDLIPLCSNCHAMIHRFPGLDIEEFTKEFKKRNITYIST